MSLGSGDRNALVLQGGGALGAYQAGVIEALVEGRVDLDWVLGTSIGAINAALYAGNRPAERIRRLREFWRRVATHSLPLPFAPTPATSRWQRSQALLSAMTLGVPAFFGPRAGSVWWDWSQDLPPTQASFYTTQPLRDTLEELIDFDFLNTQAVRYSATAVDIDTAEPVVFDNTERTIDVRHVLASGALPPGFPAVDIDGRLYWDGGVYSNTPLDVLLCDRERADTLCFVVDLWQLRAPAPRSINGVFSRQKEIQYGSRSREHLEEHRRRQNMRRAIRQLIERVPVEQRDPRDFEAYAALGCGSVIHVVHLALEADPVEDATQDPNRDIDFDAHSLARRREVGLEDARRMLGAAPWTQPLSSEVGLVVHELAPRPDPTS